MISCTKGCFQLCAHNFLRPAHQDEKKTNLLLLQTSRCTWRRRPLLKIQSRSFLQSKSDWNHPQEVWRMWISVNNKATLSQVPLCCSRWIRQDNWSAFSRFYFFFELYILTHIFLVASNFKTLTRVFLSWHLQSVFSFLFSKSWPFLPQSMHFKIFCLFVIFLTCFYHWYLFVRNRRHNISHFLWLNY